MASVFSPEFVVVKLNEIEITRKNNDTSKNKTLIICYSRKSLKNESTFSRTCGVKKLSLVSSFKLSGGMSFSAALAMCKILECNGGIICDCMSAIADNISKYQHMVASCTVIFVDLLTSVLPTSLSDFILMRSLSFLLQKFFSLLRLNATFR